MKSDSTDMMTDELTRMVCGLYPEQIDVKVGKSNKWYKTLLSYAASEGIAPRSARAYFVVTVRFDFMGFHNDDGCWKIVYKPQQNMSCTLFDYDGKLLLANKDKIFLETLLVISNALSEVVLVIPVIEKAVDHFTRSDKTTVDIPYWRFARPDMKTTGP